MQIITKTYLIEAKPEKVWAALTESKLIDAWGGGPAKMSAEPGKRFALWGGDIFGANTEIRPKYKLVQDWYAYDWTQPSKVTFFLKAVQGGTNIDLKHEDVPDKEAAKIAQGWDEHYFGAIKKYLEEKV